ncbi:MAG: DegT/DnrJ/EryC1/StrS family aminotransferase [Verrucomicrobiota bacterium]
MKVPFLDLKAHHAPMRADFEAAIKNVLDSGIYASGPAVQQFEKEFATFCGCTQAIGVGNGTEALWFALLACGVGPGDEVITVPSTFMATAEAITYCGATPVFVDVDERTYTMNPDAIESAVTERTKAIVPVHLFGQCADMDPILEIGRDLDLTVIEDAAQAHGAEYKGRRAGSMGAAGCFSFYPGKNLGALGEAGAVVTNDEKFADIIRVLRDHGQVRKYHHTMIGWNGRMDAIQAALLSVKLRHLEHGNELRRTHARRYSDGFGGSEVKTPLTADYSKHVFHIYAIRVPERDEVMRQLEAKGISTGVHYPVPVHLQEAYAHLGHGTGSFPVAEQIARDFVSLPMYPELSGEQVDYVIESVQAVAGAGVAA